MQIGWADKFFEPEKYFEGNKILHRAGRAAGLQRALPRGALVGANVARQPTGGWPAATWASSAVALVFTAGSLDFPAAGATALADVRLRFPD